MSAAHGPYYTFFSIHLVGLGYSKAATGWLWALGVACEIGIFMWMPRLYRAFTLRQILIASFALAVMRFLAVGWLAQTLAVLFAQVLHAATFGAFHAASIGYVHRYFRGRCSRAVRRFTAASRSEWAVPSAASEPAAIWARAGAGLTFDARRGLRARRRSSFSLRWSVPETVAGWSW